MNKKFSFFAFILWLSLAAPSCKEAAPPSPPVVIMAQSLDSLKAGVACAHPEAARIGAEILAAGGNAIDAATAMQWALAVCYPEAGNIGGGGFMVLRNSDGSSATLDFREKAPSAASANMYLNAEENPVEGSSTDTHLSSGVPGSVRGIFDAHERYGSMPMDQLINPAIALAAKGFPVTQKQAEYLNLDAEVFTNRNRAPVAFVRSDRPWQDGDTLVQTELAATLKRIRDQGPAGFYEGVTAALIADEMAAGAGLISAYDLKNYNAIWREPLTFPFGKYTIISMPPPSSGGVALAQIMGMYSDCIKEELRHNSPEYIHAMVESERRAYADRSYYLGDPDFTDVPVKALMDSLYLRRRMDNFTWAAATPSSAVSYGTIATFTESMETTHLSVIDAQGNAVSVTTTLNDNFGNKIVVTGAGFLLNNEMDDFSIKPGVPNMFGLVGGDANAIAPGKRMLSSMTPAIVTKDGNLFLVVGSPGGSTIITSVLQTIMNTAHFGMTLTVATAAPKFHSQWLPDVVYVEENRFDENALKKLEALGHKIMPVPSLGRVDAIRMRTDGTLEAVGDPRSDNQAAGYR